MKFKKINNNTEELKLGWVVFVLKSKLKEGKRKSYDEEEEEEEESNL